MKTLKMCQMRKSRKKSVFMVGMRIFFVYLQAEFRQNVIYFSRIMYVIVEIAGQQFKAEKGRKLYVHRLQGDVESSVSFDKVLLVDNDGQVKVGAPAVEGASVKCKILKHLKDDKVLVFKKKRRTGYQKCNGHRQYLTQILVEDIVA